MNNNTITPKFIDDESFQKNLDASSHILAGNIEVAKSILSELDENFLQLTIKRCKFLLKRDKKILKPNQKLCLTTKIQLCNELL